MVQTSFPYDDGPGASVTETSWREMARHFVDNGVLPTATDPLLVLADNTGMQVKVNAGAAWLNGQFYNSSAVETVPIPAADPTNPRIDRVVVRNDYVTNESRIQVVQGTPAASPTAPPLTINTSQFEVSLATVTVAAGATSLAAASVTDDRSLVAGSGDRFDPGAASAVPSLYPTGLSAGLADSANGWPVTGVLITARRGGRLTQHLKGFASNLSATATYTRQGVFGGGVNGWGPWQREDTYIHTQTVDLPSIAANSTADVVITITPAGTIPATTFSAIYIRGLVTHGLVVQRALVTGVDQITLRVSNLTGSAIDQTAQTFGFLLRSDA